MTALRIVLAALAAFAMPALAQEVDAQATISRLGQAVGSTLDFTEVRFSAMLKEPLIISGVLHYAGPDALDREVLSPYHETTQIRDDAVTISREGEKERRIALRRAPELQGLLRAFTALLSGSHAALEQDFTIATTGDAQHWQLELTPRDARLRERMSRLRIDGEAGQSRCFWLFGAEDDAGFSVMLLGPLAHAEHPEALTREWLQMTCTG